MAGSGRERSDTFWESRFGAVWGKSIQSVAVHITLLPTMKKRLLLFALAFITVLVAVIVADFLGFLPTLSRALAQCKADAFKQLINVKRFDDKPVTDSVNVVYFSKHTELVQTCMESRGYIFDDRNVAIQVTQTMKMLRADPKMIASLNYDQIQLERNWHRRWFWQ